MGLTRYLNASSRNKLEIRDEGEVGEDDVGEHLQHSPPINLQDIHMLYWDEGFEEDSNKLEIFYFQNHVFLNAQRNVNAHKAYRRKLSVQRRVIIFI